MKSIILSTVILLLFHTLKAQKGYQFLDDSLQMVLDQSLHPKGAKAVHNIQFSYLYKDIYQFHGASGLDKKNGTPLSANHQFKIASVTKTFTATIILQMVEESKLKLEDKISQYFDSEIIDNLHIYKKQKYGQDITIQQLLSHTSGLADYIFDDLKFMVGLKLSPSKSWTPKKLLDNYFKHKINKKAKFIPGKGYHYSDTNYLLLGILIEKLSNSSLASQYRKRIIEPIGMTKTYFDYAEKGSDKIMHQYFNRRNVNKTLNTSFDWAGGGLVSTTKDLALFIRALFKNQLFKNKETLKLMLPEESEGYRYGLGLEGFYFHTTHEGKDLKFKTYGHSGFWGVYMRYIPEEDITAVYSFGQSSDKYHVSLGRKALEYSLKYFNDTKSKLVVTN